MPRRITLIESEQKIIEQTNELNSTLASMQDVVYKTDVNGCIVWATPSIEEQSGYSLQEVIGANITDFYVNPEERKNFLTALAENGGVLNSYEVEIKTKSGQKQWVSANSHYYYDEHGAVLGVEGSLHNITALKKVERELLGYRDHLQELVDEKTHDLVIARDEAQMAERTMSTFLANMSHELRTPLHGILSYASFGLKKYETATKGKLVSYFAEIQGSGQNLLALVNDLLDLSKLRAGKIVYEYQQNNMQEIVKNVIREFSVQCEERDNVIALTVTDSVVPTKCDRDKIGQVVRNLLSNALKFSPENSEIEISITNIASGGTEVSVLDLGIGIPPNEIHSIFDAFKALLPEPVLVAPVWDWPSARKLLRRGMVARLWPRTGKRVGRDLPSSSTNKEYGFLHKYL